jgi:hypothetical protein
MPAKKNTSPLDLKKTGMFLLMAFYLLLSGFSFFELLQFSKMVSSEPLRIKLLIVFGIAVLLPVFLVSMDGLSGIFWMKVILELTPFVILVVFYLLSCKEELSSKQSLSELFSILISDVISSLLLFLFHKVLHSSNKAGYRPRLSNRI